MAPFGKDTKDVQPRLVEGRYGAAPTVIAKNTTLDGELTGGAGVRVEGRVKGTVSLKAPLDVAAGATIEAEVRASAVRVAGTVIGNVTASELVELLAGGMVKGDITAPSLHVVEGAKLEGRVHMQADRPAEAPAKPPQ